MKVMLTSLLDDINIVNGDRLSTLLIEKNGLLNNLKSIWPNDSKVLFICSAPSDYVRNDNMFECMKKPFVMSGLNYSTIVFLW